MKTLKSLDELVSCDCGKIAELVTGREVYGERRPDLFGKKFYLCRPCNAWVGCHDGTTKPMGSLANAELRQARQSAHAAFDPLWRRRLLVSEVGQHRTKAYVWLAERLGIRFEDCHIGMMTLEQCRRVVELCEQEVMK